MTVQQDSPPSRILDPQIPFPFWFRKSLTKHLITEGSDPAAKANQTWEICSQVALWGLHQMHDSPQLWGFRHGQNNQQFQLVLSCCVFTHHSLCWTTESSTLPPLPEQRAPLAYLLGKEPHSAQTPSPAPISLGCRWLILSHEEDEPQKLHLPRRLCAPEL